MSLFSMATGAGKQAEKLRLRKAEARAKSLENAVERAHANRENLREAMHLQNLLTAVMIRRKILGVARAAKLPIRHFNIGGVYSQFSRASEKRAFRKLKMDFSRQVSNGEAAAIGLFGAGAVLNILAGLDRNGYITIPDWHVPLGDILADWGVPSGDMLAEVAAEIGADTLLDVIGDVTIVLGIAKGIWNLKKANDFSNQADSLETASKEIEAELDRERERMQSIRDGAKEFDTEAYALFKAATLIDVASRRRKRISPDLRKRLSDALSQRLSQFNMRLSEI